MPKTVLTIILGLLLQSVSTFASDSTQQQIVSKKLIEDEDGDYYIIDFGPYNGESTWRSSLDRSVLSDREVCLQIIRELLLLQGDTTSAHPYGVMGQGYPRSTSERYPNKVDFSIQVEALWWTSYLWFNGRVFKFLCFMDSETLEWSTHSGHIIDTIYASATTWLELVEQTSWCEMRELEISPFSFCNMRHCHNRKKQEVRE